MRQQQTDWLRQATEEIEAEQEYQPGWLSRPNMFYGSNEMLMLHTAGVAIFGVLVVLMVAAIILDCVM